VLQTLCDDLNTPGTLTRLHAIAGEIRGPASGLDQIELERTFKASAELLGLLETTCSVYLSRHPRRKLVDPTRINALVEARTRARAAKNFAESDRIRNELAAMGVVVKDSKDGTTWEVAR
jgi:cysteinyl-tRNA synthetase